MHPDLSIVILAYRAEEAIIDFVEELTVQLSAHQVHDYELVLVANYDSGEIIDRTPEIVQNLTEADSRIKAVIEPKKGMMGWDARKGLAAAKGSIIALIDGDGQMPPEDIVRAHRVMISGEFDFVKTYRVSREDGFLRLLASQGFNFIYRLLFPKCGFRDINSKPKFISRRALDKMELSCDGWFFDGELILEIIRLGLPFAEIPTTFRKNEWRGSFVKPSTVVEMSIAMLAYRFRLRRKSITHTDD